VKEEDKKDVGVDNELFTISFWSKLFKLFKTS